MRRLCRVNGVHAYVFHLRAIAVEAERRIGLPFVGGPTSSVPDALRGEEAMAAGRPATPDRDSRARARPRAGTAARDRRRGRGLGVGQLGAGGLARRLRRGQLRKRLAAQHRGRGVCGRPACFEAFAARRDIAPATIRNRVVRLGRHRCARRARERPTSSAPCSPTATGSEAWCLRERSSGTTIRRPGRAPGWSARAGERPLPGAPSHHRRAPPAGAVTHPPTRPKRPPRNPAAREPA